MISRPAVAVLPCEAVGKSTGIPDVLTPRAAAGLPWLIRLRWGILAGQAVTVATGSVILDTGLPLSLGVGLLAVTLVSNLALGSGLLAVRAATPAVCGTVLGLDTVVLTLLLLDSGGPANPFSVLYLVGISLSALVLGTRWTWILTLLAIAGYGSLFVLATAQDPHHSFASHLHGMWVAFTMAAVLTAYFVGQLASAVERGDRELAVVRERALRYERVASLSTLAAGAAHELGTPLASIGVAARELELALERLPAEPRSRMTRDSFVPSSAGAGPCSTAWPRTPAKRPEKLRSCSHLRMSWTMSGGGSAPRLRRGSTCANRYHGLRSSCHARPLVAPCTTWYETPSTLHPRTRR